MLFVTSDAVLHCKHFSWTIYSKKKIQMINSHEHHWTWLECFIRIPYLTGLTELSLYKELLDGSRWEHLIEQFQDTHSNLFHMINLPQNGPFTSAYLRQSNTKRYNYPLFQLASQSVFTVALQAGHILYKYNKKVWSIILIGTYKN